MIKGFGRINTYINKREAEKIKGDFYLSLSRQPPTINSKPAIDISVRSFSGLGEVPDQVLSIYSFMKNVGIPRKWTIVSDGFHTPETKVFFDRFPFVEFCTWEDVIKPEHAKFVREQPSWQAKKLFIICDPPLDGTTIYTDSDVFFFENFLDGHKSITKHNWFLSSPKAYVDPGFPIEKVKGYNYINAGFLILNEPFDTTPAIDYFLNYVRNGGKLGQFTEQSAMQLLAHENDFRFLDPRLFCLSTEDLFTLKSKIDTTKLAMRHYVGTVRFRMWQEAHRRNLFV